MDYIRRARLDKPTDFERENLIYLCGLTTAFEGGAERKARKKLPYKHKRISA